MGELLHHEHQRLVPAEAAPRGLRTSLVPRRPSCSPRLASLAALVSAATSRPATSTATQPAKLAAFEGHYRTGPGDLNLLGIPNDAAGKVDLAVGDPRGLELPACTTISRSPLSASQQFRPGARCAGRCAPRPGHRLHPADDPPGRRPFRRFPGAAAVVVLSVLAIANVPRAVYRRRYGQAFLSSALVIACLVALFGLALYPDLVPASNDPARSWTLKNAASSPRRSGSGSGSPRSACPSSSPTPRSSTRTFRGKVKRDEHAH